MKKQAIEKYLETIRQDRSFVSADVLEPLPYSNPAENTWVEINNTEFTSLCPKTGLPDFGTINIKYLPDRHIIELKSLKYYFISYRNVGIYQEKATDRIFKDLKKVLKPKYLYVETVYNTRGGIDSKCFIESK